MAVFQEKSLTVIYQIDALFVEKGKLLSHLQKQK